MGWVSWVELFCAISSLIAAIKIACVQYRQAEQMKQFELRQDARDEARYAAKNRAQAIEFISMHYSDRGLIPLCAIAAMHNRLFCYSREIYRSYCCLVPEVQNLILEYLELDLRVKPESNLFERCTAAVEGELLSRFPAVITPFYDNGKYLIRSLERYAGAKIPQGRISVNPNYSSDVPLASEDGVDIQLYLQDIVIKLDEAFRSERSFLDPISELKRLCAFSAGSEINACKFAAGLAYGVAICASGNCSLDANFGSPGGFDGERIRTMEDLFLLSIFEIYTRLLLPKESCTLR